MTRLLVTGAGGMLGHDVGRAADRAGWEIVLMERRDLDITDRKAVVRAFAQARPEAVVNCAAWTDVDGAESQPDLARAVNVQGARNLATVATDVGAKLVHVSTDYVFDGRPPLDDDGRPRPYLEKDPTAPRSVYGATKLAGEEAVIVSSSDHVVVRSAWIFGVHGRNFADTMLTLARDRESVRVVDDQIGCPTWSGHLAPALLGLIEREVSGLVHLAGTGAVSWNGFAREIFRQAELSCRVDVASTDEMARARPAPRPAYSVLGTERDDVLAMPDWRDGLAGYLAARAGVIRT